MRDDLLDGNERSPWDLEVRTKVLERLLVEKGLITGESVDRVIDLYEEEIGPMNGARVVARAWVNPEFKKRLLENGKQAIEEMGLGGLEAEAVVVVENTDAVHNVVVCTLCSCYPWSLLGLPPTWYKSPEYRSRVVLEPRVVLREFGLAIPDQVEVHVWDSTSEIRYLVLPERLKGSENLNEEELAELVTRDAMIGTGKLELKNRGGGGKVPRYGPPE